MKQSRIKHLKKGAAGIVLLVCVICYSVGGHRNGREKAISGFPNFDGAEVLDLKADEAFGEGNGAGEISEKEEDSSAWEAAAHSGQNGAQSTVEEAAPVGKEERLIYIHVCGEVLTPGVYELSEGSRVYQAVEAAGGLTDEAADEFLNMAQILSDGLQIYVPKRGEAADRPAFASAVGGNPAAAADGMGRPADGRINLNTATKEELMTLAGIGEARAEAILSYRREAGPFQTIEDIMKVSGIKEAAFQKIKEDITV